MKCRQCGEAMQCIRHGEDEVKGWLCQSCMESFDDPIDRAENWEMWWRDQCLCPGDE